MLGVNRREHLLLAQELVVVLLGLGIETRIVIGIPGLRASRARIYRLVQTAQTPRAGLPGPSVVAVSRIPITIAQQAGAASVLGREFGTEQEQPQAVGSLEVGIDGQRLDFGSADEVVTGVVAELSVCNFKERLVVAGVNGVTIEIAEIVVVGLNRAPHVVPDDLGRNVRIVRVDQRERLAG